jgi:hypothetical protein
LEKAEQLAELQSHLVGLSESGLPLSVHPPFLELLLRQEDPRYAFDFFNALSRLGPRFLPQVGTPLAILARGLGRRDLSTNPAVPIRELRGEDPRHFQTPAWLGRFREVLNDHFSAELEEIPAELPLGDVFPIHYLDNHARGDGATALNGSRQNILRRLYLQHWRPGNSPSAQELAVALLDDQSHLPLLSTSDAQGRRLLLNGHHRIGALITLVADGLLPEEILGRIPFHVAAQVEPEALIHRAFAGASLPNPRTSPNWLELLSFDERSRDWLELHSLNQDLVGWIRQVRVEGRERGARHSPREL